MHLEQLAGYDIFLVHDFLTPEECATFIARSEEIGYDDAPITTSAGFVMRKDVRNNERVMLDDDVLAAEWFDRARPFLPADWFGWELAGLNERFRFYRYDPGQRFAPHTDGYFRRSIRECSFVTWMVYLNDDFEGGETVFAWYGDPVRVKPRTGMVLGFAHRLLHEGAEVIRGRKYVLRTDVMYRRGAGPTLG